MKARVQSFREQVRATAAVAVALANRTLSNELPKHSALYKRIARVYATAWQWLKRARRCTVPHVSAAQIMATYAAARK